MCASTTYTPEVVLPVAARFPRHPAALFGAGYAAETDAGQGRTGGHVTTSWTGFVWRCLHRCVKVDVEPNECLE